MKPTFLDFLLTKFPEGSVVFSAYKTDEEMKRHFLSGEVTVRVTDVLEWVEEYNNLKDSNEDS